MKILFNTRDEYLEVVISDTYSFPDFFALISRIAGEARRNGRTLILVDTMRLVGMPGDFERYELGVEAAEELPPPCVTLVLAEPEKINKFGETVAVNRGAIVLSTSDRKYGMRWLFDGNRKVPLLHDPF